MKTSFGKGYGTIISQNNIKSNKFYKNYEQFKSSVISTNQTIYQSIFNQNQYNNNTNNIVFNKNYKKIYNEKNNINNTIPLDKIINLQKNNTNIIPNMNFNLKNNINPSHMKFNNRAKIVSNQYSSQSQEKTNNNLKVNLKGSVLYQNNNSKNIYKDNFPKKKMGNSQINFYPKNNMNLYPNISNNNILREKDNLFSINSNWMIYSQNAYPQQELYNDYIINMINNKQKQLIYNENFKPIFDFEYKRKEERLRKGQNQLILERLQKKYETQFRGQNMHRTGTGFYHKNKRINKRQRSAQDNNNNLKYNNQESENYKKETQSEISKKNSINSLNNKNLFDKERIQIDANNSIENNKKKFNKTYNNGFNVKKFNKERKKKQKLIFAKIFKYFRKKTKNNYLWVRYFNKKIKMRLNSEENYSSYNNVNSIVFKRKQKSLDKNNIYPKLIKKIIRKNVIFKNTKKIFIQKVDIRYNTDNSEIDEVKEYKKIQKKLKNKKSEYANYINKNKENKKGKLEIESSSESDDSFFNKKEPQFRGVFEQDNKIKNNTNANEPTNEKEKERHFNFRTTSNFFSKNNNFKEKKQEKNQNEKTNEEKKKFNIENIINNVIENNKKAAAAKSSTSFYNIGSNFMNNRMRSTRTNFFSSKDNRGGGFTGTKDSNFTKAQANEGRYYKSNSLKLTLINPLGWRKHEEIWSNLVSLKLGLSDLEKYLHPPNDTDILVSSYLKMNPRILNFCSIQKINTSKTNNENSNFISFMIDDNIQNPRQEIKKWKEAYKRAIFRWHPDKLFHNLEEINFKNEQQKIELKKKSTQIINNMNTLYRNIIEILNKIAEAKNDKEENK